MSLKKPAEAEKRVERDEDENEAFFDGPVGRVLIDCGLAIVTGMCFALGTNAAGRLIPLKAAAKIIPLKSL